MTRTARFTVTGEQTIHCEGCEQRIGRALKRLDGVEEVRAGAESQRVAVEFDPEKIGPEEMRERLDLLGYEAVEGDAA
ncbi:MAG: heavy-metal-associated domain-containing protein [Rubrobacteraceae bacterium]